jgi:hypothetical protein
MIEITSDLFTPQIRRRFNDYILKTDTCWYWRGAKGKRGYGLFRINGVTFYAHRLSYFLANGSISDLDVMHSCDHRPCCNPAHLSQGTRLENIRDAVQKGRHQHGETNHKSKLKEQDIKDIRAKWASKKYTTIQLSDEYNVSRRHIYTIINEKQWTHLP